MTDVHIPKIGLYLKRENIGVSEKDFNFLGYVHGSGMVLVGLSYQVFGLNKDLL